MDKSTIWPATILANKRMAKTACLINRPITSITHSIGLMIIPMDMCKSMDGSCANQKPTGPCIMLPEISDVRKMATANPPVTANVPVGDPINGMSPNRLQVSMKKKMVHRTGVILSAFVNVSGLSSSVPWP